MLACLQNIRLRCIKPVNAMAVDASPAHKTNFHPDHLLFQDDAGHLADETLRHQTVCRHGRTNVGKHCTAARMLRQVRTSSGTGDAEDTAAIGGQLRITGLIKALLSGPFGPVQDVFGPSQQFFATSADPATRPKPAPAIVPTAVPVVTEVPAIVAIAPPITPPRLAPAAMAFSRNIRDTPFLFLQILHRPDSLFTPPDCLDSCVTSSAINLL